MGLLAWLASCLFGKKSVGSCEDKNSKSVKRARAPGTQGKDIVADTEEPTTPPAAKPAYMYYDENGNIQITGKANSVHRYLEDQPIQCHFTPFFARLDEEIEAEAVAKQQLENVNKRSPFQVLNNQSIKEPLRAK